jgi:CRISPR-associated endonuclease/helicase Cas3
MSKLNSADFPAFFGALHRDPDGKPLAPFPWQKKLAKRVVGSGETRGVYPNALALPTASGKTACIDIALFALACQADQPPQKRSAPRRMFFVVDRRVIVDEAFEHASEVAKKLTNARDGILRTVADRLRKLAGLSRADPPLACFELRGGIYRDDAWVRTPTQPCVIASTVDQIGSRLLFRGYGVSPWAWPIHAGLVANDSLIILDEAHCSQPFMETLHAIWEYRQWGELQPLGPFHAVVLSATLPAGITDVLRADAHDLRHPVLGKRLNALKPTRLMIAKRATGAQALDALAKELCEQTLGLVETGQAKAVALIVNRVATAKLAYELLLQAGRGDVVLLTGRMRPIDRDKTVKQWLRKLHADFSGRRDLARNVFVVATQCLEVGANLDFDAMVTECASLDALRQRFGRLNRTGRPIEAQGVIVIRHDQTRPEKEREDQDPIYGNALPETWAWLKSQVMAGAIDMGVAALDARLGAAPLVKLQILAPHAPVMLPAHVDCWVQTAPEPCPTPDVSVFLHGPEQGAPEIQVCWRADLNADEPDEDVWVDTVCLCPPSAAECMPVPLYVFRRWMEGDLGPTRMFGDVEGSRQPVEQEQGGSGAYPTVLRWGGPEDAKLLNRPSQIRPGDLLVLPSSLRGWEVLGHVPDLDSEDDPNSIDAGDQAHLAARALPVVRLHPHLISAWPASEQKKRLLALVTSHDLPHRVGEPDFVSEIRELLMSLGSERDTPEWLRTSANALARERRLAMCITLHPAGGLVLRGTKRLRSDVTEAENFADYDRAGSNTVPILLFDHSKGVARKVKDFAERCGLKKHAGDFELAATLHDLGKADLRFQCLLRGGNPVTLPLLAKSNAIPLGGRAFRSVAERIGYPLGGRHELLSLRLAHSAVAPLRQTHDPQLVLHLIASHHGRCRPFAPVVDDPNPQTVNVTLFGQHLQASSDTKLECLDSGVPERFWHLVRRYGWWGLAYMEAVFRLADHRQSEAEERSGVNQP